ncbi:MAG: tRNA (pseudouridine(54)-N(1))-methyltransferase TrmY [Thermoplasmatota archaeon]
MKRRFVLLGRRATTSPRFLLDDLAGAAGRLDALLRGVRAGLLLSHAVRRDAEVTLLLGGPPSPPRAVRFRGDAVQRLNPDERSTAALVQRALATPVTGPVWQESTPGVAVAALALDEIVATAPRGARLFVAHEAGEDARAVSWRDVPDALVVIGDTEGFTTEDETALAKAGARSISVGPRALMAEDVVTLLHNEWDRADLSAK